MGHIFEKQLLIFDVTIENLVIANCIKNVATHYFPEDLISSKSTFLTIGNGLKRKKNTNLKVASMEEYPH